MDEGNKIVAIVKPFGVKQEVYVFKDGVRVDFILCKMNEIKEKLLSLSKEYQLTYVELLGSKQYNAGLAKRLRELEFNKFQANEIVINVK